MSADAFAGQAAPVKANPNGPTEETVLSVEHYTDRLFRFRLTRPQSFRFRSGEFVMIGLPKEDGKPLLRAYSIASPAWDEELEFYSIKVPDGPLTSRLQKIQPGDKVLLGRKPTGTLVLDALTPGKRLYMFSTGTGFAPFASLVRMRIGMVPFGQQHPQGGDERNRLVQHHERMGRITTLIENGKLFSDLGVPPLDPATDRAMICGSMEMIQDVKTLMLKAGLTEGSNAAPAEFVIEKAFAG
ncbi:MAG: ferredoxin--NADP(+) reductase [Hyphomonas sp. 32-62-5]|nr:MAG: ferredoxin--NADP(+) reductase [Hyphomonas sp. 32-62-5]